MTISSFLVSPQWLVEHRQDLQLVIVDCRFSLANPHQGRQEYETGHIPGAFYLDLNQDLSRPAQIHGGRHPLPHPNQLSQTLSHIGITSGQTQVIVYDNSRMAFAARCWWLLRYLGHQQVAILDGGWQGWQELGYPITSDPSVVKAPGQFMPQIQPDWIVSGEDIEQLGDRQEVILVDSREYERYIGKTEPIDPVAGHIPGAINVPWQLATTPSGWSQPLAAHQARWQPYQNTSELWVYCGSGVTACVNLFSLALAGRPQEKLYPGSWSDWCSWRDRPTVNQFLTS